MSTTNFSDVNTSGIKEKQNYQDWRTMCPYKLMRDLYYGEGIIGNTDNKGSGLVPNSTELYYVTRGQLTPYTPWFMLHIDAQYVPLYSEEAPLYEVAKNAEPFLLDVTRGGMSINEFQMEQTQNAIMDGVIFQASGYDGDTSKYPWFHYYTASQYNKDLVAVDAFGAVEKYVFTNKRIDAEDNEYYEHNVYEDNTYQEYRSEDVDVLGKPYGDMTKSYDIAPLYSQRREQGQVLVKPKNRAVAGLCVAVYNSESDQRWVLRVQGHSIFVITADVAPKGFGDGLTQGLRIDVTENQGGAEFVAPPAELSKEQRESKQEILGQLFEVMRHAGVIAQRSSQIPESGASKAYTFQPVNVVMGKAENMAQAQIRYMNGAFKYYTSQDIELVAVYKDDFTPSAGVDIVDLITILNEFKDIGLSRGVLVALKQLAISLGADEELIKEIDEFTLESVIEIESTPVE